MRPHNIVYAETVPTSCVYTCLFTNATEINTFVNTSLFLIYGLGVGCVLVACCLRT